MYWGYHSGMDWARFTELLRYPLEIVSLGLALAPALIVLQSRVVLPRQVLAGYGAMGRSAPRGKGAYTWILSLIALIVYGFMSHATGTLAWVIDRSADVPAGAEILLLLKPLIGFLIIYATGTLVRSARKEEESVNGFLVWGLMSLMVAPPLALSMVVR